MNALIITGETKYMPATLSRLLDGTLYQPIEVDEELGEDLLNLERYLKELNPEKVYVLYGDVNIPSLREIIESSIQVDAYFTCL